MAMAAKKGGHGPARISAAKASLAGSILFKKLGGLPGKCSCTRERKLFREALKEAGVKNVEDYIEWAEERGGHCDCEVFLNAMSGKE
jgi:hypothetical protein